MASKIKVDTIETADGTGNITVNNNLVVTTMTSTGDVNFSQEVHLDSAKKMKFKANGSVSGSRYWQIRNDDSGYGWLGFKYSDSTSDENYTSSLQLTSDGRGLSQFTAKAWINFNGNGVVYIRDSHNVSSITDQGTGDYTVNFSNNMTNTNYAPVSGFQKSPTANGEFLNQWYAAQAVGSFRCQYFSGSVVSDTTQITFAVFGD